ncbi:transcription factor subunit Med10 of mediator complex-domain-containing protein [Dipodascopsis uninucleata]
MATTDKQVPLSLQEQETRLRQIIETILELAISVHDYESVSQSREAVVSRVNLLTSQLSDLNQFVKQPSTQPDNPSEPSISDILVPREIIQYIEDGRNPNVYTREFVELLVKQNQFVNGKMEAMREFRDELAKQIINTYPDLQDTVNFVRESTRDGKCGGYKDRSVTANGKSTKTSNNNSEDHETNGFAHTFLKNEEL